MLWMREKAGLKDGGKIGCGHLIDIRLCGKNCKEIQDIQQ
jgi:hypothetical protein